MSDDITRWEHGKRDFRVTMQCTSIQFTWPDSKLCNSLPVKVTWQHVPRWKLHNTMSSTKEEDYVAKKCGYLQLLLNTETPGSYIGSQTQGCPSCSEHQTENSDFTGWQHENATSKFQGNAPCFYWKSETWLQLTTFQRKKPDASVDISIVT